jgi:hypothetical protein
MLAFFPYFDELNGKLGVARATNALGQLSAHSRVLLLLRPRHLLCLAAPNSQRPCFGFPGQFLRSIRVPPAALSLLVQSTSAKQQKALRPLSGSKFSLSLILHLF